MKQKYGLYGVSIEHLASGGGGWVYRVVISDVSNTVVGVDTSLRANKKRFYEFMTGTMKRNVPRSGAKVPPDDFILKLQVTTTHKNIDIIKTVEKNQVKEDFMAHFLCHSPISKKYVPTFYMGGTYAFQKFRLRLSCMEYVKGFQLEQLLQSNVSIPKAVIPKLEKACMALWSQGIVHGDLHGGNVLVLQNPIHVIIIDYGLSERYNNSKSTNNISRMRGLVRRLENHV